MKLLEFETEEKLRGSFYTPKTISNFILKWAFNGNHNCSILEPSCGDGVFLESILEHSYKYSSITAVEIDKAEAKKARKIGLKNLKVLNQDFHIFCNNTKEKFDIIIGNPPYIRYQYFDREQQKEAEKIFNSNNIKYNKLMNAWCSFVVGTCSLLKKNGKLGFVLPAELLQVSYAKQIREFIVEHFSKITIISFKKLVFPDIQQDVVLLLCEKGDEPHHIEHIELDDDKALASLDMIRVKTPKKNIYDSTKWTNYFLDQAEIDFLNAIKSNNLFTKLGDLARIEVGITTGANDFFTVPKDTLDKYNLSEYAKPLVGRSVQIEGINFNNEDWNENYLLNSKSNLLIFPNKKNLIKNKLAMNYIKYGESQKYNKGYKCGIREEWQIIPSISLSNAFFSRRNNIYAKIILNEANAYTTDTMHRVWINNNIEQKALIASYYNSISFCCVEIEGRSFGGGALELMPNEVKNILIPYHIKNIEFFNEIDLMIRKKTNIDKILKYTDNIILKENLGLDKKDINLAQSIRQKLTTRRLARKGSK